MAEHHHVGIDQSEGINYNLQTVETGEATVYYFTKPRNIPVGGLINAYFSFDTLNGVHHYSHSPLGQGLKALLCVDINSRKPAAKTRMTVVPAHHHLRPEQKSVHTLKTTQHFIHFKFHNWCVGLLNFTCQSALACLTFWLEILGLRLPHSHPAR